MKSGISWLDYNSAAREKTLQVLSLFREKDSRDELGVAGIRDSIADQLFPGTSTIQTRLRYFFFIPWQYSLLENKGVTPERFQGEGRQSEIRLSELLIRSLRTEQIAEIGVIGSAAGSTLRRLPSSIYWAGMARWHVRQFQGTTQQYFAQANRIHQLRKYQRKLAETNEMDEPRSHNTWHPRVLQLMPEGFPANTDLRITRPEAELLLDLWSNHTGDSLLAWLAQDMAKTGKIHDCDEIWAHPRSRYFPQHLQQLLEHARRFSALVQGAALLYNLLLAELRPDMEGLTDLYREKLEDWRSKRMTILNDWDIQVFWPQVIGHGHTISPSTQRFFQEAHLIILNTQGAIADYEPARQLIRQRERQLKRGRSRFDNPAVLKQWGGSSGTYPLNFRWPIAKRHLKDWLQGYIDGESS